MCRTAAGLLLVTMMGCGLTASFTVGCYRGFAQNSQQVFDAVALSFKLLYMFGLKAINSENL